MLDQRGLHRLADFASLLIEQVPSSAAATHNVDARHLALNPGVVSVVAAVVGERMEGWEGDVAKATPSARICRRFRTVD